MKPSGTRAARKVAYMILAVLIYLYFRGIGDHGLLDPIEGTNASVALNMAVSGNFSVPMADGRLYTGNSMGFWWLSALSLFVFEWSEFAVRLWSVLGGLGMAAAGWFIALRTGGERAANYAAALIGSSLLVYISSQLASPHALYACLVATSLLGAVYAFRNKRFFILLHASAALAFVVYGPAGVVLPWLSLLVYAVLAKQERFFAKALFYWPGLLFTVLIAGGYVLFLKNKNPYILTLMLHNIPGDAFNSLSSALLFLAFGFFPWLGALPGAVKSALPRRLGLVFPSERHKVLLLVWCGVFLFFGAFARDAMLLAAAFPAVGVLCADYLAQAEEKENVRLLQRFVALEILLLTPLLFVGLPWFYMACDKTLRHTLMTAIPWGIFCLLFLWAGWRCARTRRVRKVTFYMCVFSLFSLLPLAGVLDLLDENFSARTAGLYLRREIKPEDVLVQYGVNHPSLSFYVGGTGPSLLLDAKVNPKIIGQGLIDENYLHRIWTGNNRVFLLIDRGRQLESPLPGNVNPEYEAEALYKVVLSNRDNSESPGAPAGETN